MDKHSNQTQDNQDDHIDPMAAHISALLDGECADFDCSELDTDATGCWDRYHLIGDVMRSSGLAYKPSSSFTERVIARLDVEPCYQAQAEQTLSTESLQSYHVESPKKTRRGLLFAIPAAFLIGGVALSIVMFSNHSNDGNAPYPNDMTLAEQRPSIQDTQEQSNAARSNAEILNDYIRVHQQTTGASPYMPVRYTPQH